MTAENAVSGVIDAKFSIVEKSDNIVPVLKKINLMHQDVLKADWEKDKMYTAGASRPAYAYLSSDKLKQNISPILARHGVVCLPLVNNVTPRPPVGSMSTHFTIEYSAMLADAETGSYIVGRVIGEAADSGDKTIGKATTSGNKLFWFNLFQIADGIDPEAAPSERVSLTEDKKDIALANGIKPAAAPPKAAAPPAAAPKAAAPPAAKAPKAAAPPAAAKPAQVVSEEAPVAPTTLPFALANTINRLVAENPDLEAEAKAISSVAEAQDFIARH